MIKLIRLRMFRPMWANEPAKERHEYLVGRFREVPAPFGLQGMEKLKPLPEFGRKIWVGVSYRHPDTRKVMQYYGYAYRYSHNEHETRSYVKDQLFFEFEPTYDKIDFHDICYRHFPKAIEIYEPRFADNSYARYRICYSNGYRPGEPGFEDEMGIEYSVVPEYNALDKLGIIPDGDFNIFSLSPVVYWSHAMCMDALGYDRDEVIRRLEGKVQHIRALNDGVYVIFDENPLLSFDDFLHIQHTYKPLLGLL